MAENDNVFLNIISETAKKAEKATPERITDYRNEDGLLVCGVCGKPREVKVNVGGSERIFKCVCKCDEEKEKKEQERIRHERELDIIKQLRRNSLMDEKFASCTFSTFKLNSNNETHLRIAKRYVDKFDELYTKNQGLLFYGNVGTGKTHLACCIGNELINKMKSVFATSLVKILSQIRLNGSRSLEEDLIKKMNAARLLILDDLGAERNTDFALETAYNIIDSRYRSKKPMIVTTNLSLQEMQTTQDVRLQRIYDRVLEVCYPVPFMWESYRMREAAGRYDDMRAFLEE